MHTCAFTIWIGVICVSPYSNLGGIPSCWYTVNDRLSAAALIKVFRFLGAALIRLRRLFDCGAYFKDC